MNDPKHRSSRWRALLQSSRQKVSTLLTSAKDRLAHLLHLPDKRSAQPTKEQKRAYIQELSQSPLSFKINVFFEAIKSIFLYGISISLICMALAAGIGAGYFAALMKSEPIPSYQVLKQQLDNTDQAAGLYFAKNNKFGAIKTDLIRTPINIHEMSPYLKDAIVATEDEDFYKHDGVVPKALLRAVISDVTGFGSQTGGSTLTQQLIKMQVLTSQVTFKRKATEVLLALRVDKYFTKKEILQDYLNVATLGRNNKGQNIAGVQEAALGLFGKNAKDLSLAEAAYIAGLPQSPSVYTPYDQDGTLKDPEYLKYGLDRKNTVLFRMYRDDRITKAEYKAAKKVDLTKEFQPKADPAETTKSYGYVYNLLETQATDIMAKQLAKEANVSTAKLNKDPNLYKQYETQATELLSTKGYQIHSTIDQEIYDAMQGVVHQQGATFGRTYTDTVTDEETGLQKTVSSPVQNGSVLLDNRTGKVISFVGGRDFSLKQTNYMLTKRSPGSTIKPLLVYGPAIDQKLIGSKTMLADFKTNFKDYAPTDYGGTIQNKFIPADEALAQSLNIPTVNLYNALKNTTDPSKYMSKMGINLTADEYSQLGISLGGTSDGVSVLEQASAFSTFADQGEHTDAYVIEKITDPAGNVVYQHHAKKKRVFSKATSYIMNQMLAGVLTDGTATSIYDQLYFNTNNLVGKTGTSNDNRDIWFIGSTPGITLASWMGYDSTGRNLTDNSSQINERYWSKLANSVYQINPSLMRLEDDHEKPSTVTSSKVLKLTGQLPGTVSINGSSQNLNGSTVTSLYNNWTPKATSYEFGIGGSARNYETFWNHYLGYNNGYGSITYSTADELNPTSGYSSRRSGTAATTTNNYTANTTGTAATTGTTTGTNYTANTNPTDTETTN
ncbi:penicillin-binding protein [Latilactobacillus curvatus]|uniref:transglycosylase domain-containing protein n=1 Tax=Latilactobacillus curvatus TaxID=28038 RepID=UPI0020C7A1DB|nr:transglycosylase domain-containing protein [Latilactobacillus curvatus]MCP8874334.1 penicillin-binding protein [Latilactobacillus curvatus]